MVVYDYYRDPEFVREVKTTYPFDKKIWEILFKGENIGAYFQKRLRRIKSQAKKKIMLELKKKFQHIKKKLKV